jgi:hypothetical protein
LLKHVKRYHPDIYTIIEQEKPKPKALQKSNSTTPKQMVLSDYNFRKKDELKNAMVQFDNKLVMEACVEMVTVNGRPFSALFDSGFRKLLQPICDKLKMSVNRVNIKEEIEKTAAVSRQALIRVLPTLLNLKMDAVKLHERSFLGINTQVVFEKKIQIYNLGHIELTAAHTGSYLKNCVIEVLNKYKIDINRIYCIATDNAANMIKTVSLLNDTQIDDPINDEEEKELSEEDEEEHNESESDGDLNVDFDLSDEEFEVDETDKDNENLSSLLTDLISAENISLIRCAAHTLQLAVKDTVIDKNIKELLAAANQFARKLRTPTSRLILKSLKKPIPVLNVKTRWSSSFDMVESLLDLRTEMNLLGQSIKKKFLLKESQWEALEKLKTAMQPVKNLTLLLQRENLLIGDFYGAWLETKVKLKNINSSISLCMKEKMEQREAALFEAGWFSACIFLDPR